jgi:hypothetical protein
MMRSRGAAISAIVVAMMLLWSGCVMPLPGPQAPDQQVQVRSVPGAPVTIEYLPADIVAAPLIEVGVLEALERTAGWGRLQAPVRIVVYPDHAALENATRRHGFRWLRAWATERDIALQSPRTWPPRERERFSSLIVHEMTHVIHYQTARIPASETRRDDPVWFREGLASVTAEQESMRYGRPMLAILLRRDPGFDPFNPDDDALRRQVALIYSVAHHAVRDLIAEYGASAVGRLLGGIAAGKPFEESFSEVFGTTPEGFQSRWRSALRSEVARELRD